MTPPATPQSCVTCGAELPADAVQGLCPACVLAAATEPVSQFTGEAVTSPSQLSTGSTSSEPPRLTPGQLFGAYRIERLLGRGGMGEVYEAEHLEDGRRVALKVLRQRLTSAVDRARFLREGEIAASVNHPHCVYLFGTDEIDGVPVIAMELAPAGTLKGRVNQFGPMSQADAVDAMLQVIAGLDAAATAGILHRDVKPSNCFIDAAGVVKIGDFGLSVSTLGRDAAEHAWSASFHGTPEFAAPEQLKGEPLDVRADIYAVGATFYYLLTGRPPFEDRDLSRLIDRVSTEAPTPLHDLRADISPAFSALVMRYLARDPVARPSSYAALTEALRPFTSAAATPATLGWRLGASLIDGAVHFVGALPLAFLTAARLRDLTPWTLPRASDWLAALLGSAITFGYYGLLEGLWGRSVGKRMLGLRVVTNAGEMPGVGRAMMRVLVLYAPAHVRLIFNLACANHLAVGVTGFVALSGLLRFVDVTWPLVVFIPAWNDRERIALHDRVTGTRVVEDAASRVQVRTVASSATLTRQPSEVRQLGPFEVIGRIGRSETSQLLLGFDASLKRHVWIHRQPPGVEPVSPARRDLNRAGRLRWLTGDRSAPDAWDAYEAPDGASFLDRSSTPQPLATVKSWLRDLVRELEDAEVEHARPPLRLDRVWITRDGRARLLEFDAPSNIASADESDHQTFASAPLLLAAIVRRALAGEYARMPISARVAIESLSNSWTNTARDAAALLEPLALAPDALSRWRRAMPIGWIGVPVVMAVGSWLFISPILGQLKCGDARILSLCLQELKGEDMMQRMRMNWSPRMGAQHDAFEVYVSGRFHPALTSERTWSNAMFVGLRPIAQTALRDHPQASSDELARATAIVQPLLDDYLKGDRQQLESVRKLGTAGGLIATPYWVLVPIAFLSILLSVFRPGGLVLDFAGATVVNRQGESISRGRSLLRAIITWSPVLVVAIGVPAGLFGQSLRGAGIAGAAAMAIMLIGAAFAIVTPERGIQDRLAGTYLVPR